MIQSLKSEATKSEDTFMHLQEIQESVRLSFLNRFLDFAGMLIRHPSILCLKAEAHCKVLG